MDNDNFEKQSTQSRIEIVKEIVTQAPQSIEEEFQRTANSWLACFGSKIFQIETYLYGEGARHELGPERYGAVMVRLSELKQKLYDLMQQDVNDTEPPNELKYELIKMLDVLQSD